MQNPDSIWPKLKPDSIFLPDSEGVLFRNGQTVFFLKGRSTYQWVSALAPHLTGEHTLQTLCSPFEADRRAMVMRLVNTLLEKGIVKNQVPEDPDLLPGAVRSQFKSQIEFIDHYADAPLYRFKQFRQSRVLLIGSGTSFNSLAISLLRNGLETLYLSATRDSKIDFREIEKESASLERKGVQTKCSTLLDTSKTLSEFQVVAYCSDKTCLRDAHLLNNRSRLEGYTFFPGIFFNGLSIIGPLSKSARRGCWLCAVLRISSNLDEAASSALWKAITLGEPALCEQPEIFTPTARMVGNTMAFELFKALAEFLLPESAGGLLIQNLENLETSRSLLLPDPLCPTCSVANCEDGI